MDLNNLQVVDLIKKNMRYQTAKERVISENLANSTTPGYLAKDVAVPDFKKQVEETQSQKLALQTTHENHLTHQDAVMRHSNNAEFEVYTPKPTSPLTIDGNGVIIEDQLNQANKASGEYNRMITIYTKYMEMLKAANSKISS